MSIKIRPAVASDAASIVQFQVAMALETESKQLDTAIVESAVSRVFADPGKGFYVVACCKNRVVGSLMITYEWSDWRDTDMWYIQSVFIEPEFRGQKIFSQMFEAVKQMARAEQVKVVRLYVESENTHAQNVYESLGMKRMPYYMYDVNI